VVVLSTHLLEHAEAFSDRFVILERGRVVREGNTEELRSTGASLADVFFGATT